MSPHSPRGLRAQRLLIGLVGGMLVVFLALPLVALVLGTPLRDLAAGLRHPLVWPALRLSLLTTGVSLVLTIALGTPLAWTLARTDSRAARVLESALQLPIVIPPSVAGVAMLFAFGRRGLLAGWLYPAGWSVAFTTAAVVIAQLFVSAPFFVQAAVSAFRRVDVRVLAVARTLGATPLRLFARVAVPLAFRGLVAGAALAWARALGEFGATLMFAGNLEGRTQTLPLAIYGALETDMRAAQALSVVLVVVSLLLLLGVRGALSRMDRSGEAAS